MEKFTEDEQPVQYAKPAIKDYGTLQELTAAGGTKFVDTPVGTPIGNVTASSTP
jgi:hypothetical protein